MVKKYLPLFEVLVEASETQRVAILKTLTDHQVHAVLEAIYNVFYGTCSLPPKDKRTLFDYRGVIRRMISEELTEKQKRFQLRKHQLILPLLLKPVIKALK